MAYALLEQIKFILIRKGITKAAQGLIEYGLIILLIAVVVITVLNLLGIQIGNLFQDITEELP